LKGAILNKGEKYYTNLGRVFDAIHNAQKHYNWLLTNVEAYPNNPLFYERLNAEYVWMTGNELTDMVEKENFPWIWAVFSGFPKSIIQEQVLKYKLPYADGYRDFWRNPVSIQHPLAEIEIVHWDSSLVLVISRSDKIVEDSVKDSSLAERRSAPKEDP